MSQPVTVKDYGDQAIAALKQALSKNEEVMSRLAARLVSDVRAGKSLFAFGSGHSALFPMELYHRAGGASFVIPVVADFLLPTSGPPVIRVLERTPGVATPVLKRAEPRAGEMLWLASQSGINAAAVDLAIEARKLGLYTVAFTSLAHSQAVTSRHASGKRLFEVCDETVDLGGKRGDALVSLSADIAAGAFSTLSSIALGHSILVAACAELESSGTRCVYTSVNTPEGEARNRGIEEKAGVRDPLLRG